MGSVKSKERYNRAGTMAVHGKSRTVSVKFHVQTSGHGGDSSFYACAETPSGGSDVKTCAYGSNPSNCDCVRHDV